ncbi:MAG: hypothetical protein OXU54_02350, partial [Gammaproteobacteria bacterium]|nr:hypothetical protein [Gammaproteobacteria bacterium]
SFTVVGAGLQPSDDVIAGCAVAAGGAAAAGDFRDSGGASMASANLPGDTLTFTSGDYMTPQSCVIHTFDDASSEPSEDFTVTLTISGGGATLGAASTTTGTIRASDLTAATFSIGDARSALEGDSLRFSVVGTGPAPGGQVIATCTVSPGDGIVASDFRDSSGASSAATNLPAPTLTFNTGDYTTPQDCVIHTFDDTSEEPSEDFTVTLTVSGGGAMTGADSTATGTIEASDHDNTIFFIRGAPSAPEGGALRFSVVGAGSMPDISELRVACTVSGAAVTAGDFRDGGDPGAAQSTDFPAPTLTFTRDNYMTPQDCVIHTFDDMLMEPDEDFTVTLTVFGISLAVASPSNAIRTTATGTILASDMPAAFSIGGAPSAPEGGALRFSVVGVNDMPSGQVIATCTVSGAAVTAGDFRDSGTAATASANFPAATLTFTPSNFMTAQHCVIYSYDDSVMENSEDFTVTLTVSGGGATTGADTTAAGTIEASDVPPRFRIFDAPEVAEGDALAFRVVGSGSAPTNFVRAVCTAAGGMEAGSGAAVAGDLRADAGAGTALGNFPAVTLSFAPYNYRAPQYCIFHTFPDDTAEGREAVRATLTVSGGGATLAAGGDTALGRIAAHTAGTSGTVTIAAAGNNGDREPSTPGLQVDEGDAIMLTLSYHGLTAGTVSSRVSGSGTATLAQSDADVNILFSEVLVVSATFPMTEFRTSLAVADDTDPEAEETLTLAIAADSIATQMATPGTFAVGTPGSVAVTIRASDRGSQALIGGADARVVEGAAINVPVEFSGDRRTAASTVAFAIGGTASSADYVVDASGSDVTFDATAAAGSIVIAAAAAAGVITVSLNPDAAADAGETLVITLTGHTGSGATATVSSAARTYTIADLPVFRFRVSADTATVEEGGTAVFTVRFSGAAPGAGEEETVDWSLSGAAAADDYMLSGADTDGTLGFTAGAMAQTLTFAFTDDALVEPAETLILTLSNPSPGGGLVQGFEQARVTIGESDRPLTLSVRPPVIALNEGRPASFNVSFPEAVATTAPVTVDWQIGFPVAAAMVVPAEAADFDTLTGSVSIPARANGAPIFITARRDMMAEPEETFIVTLNNPRGGGNAMPGLAADPTATATIAAGLGRAFFSISGTPSAAEGGALSFEVASTGRPAPSGDVTATCTVSGGGVTAGDFRDSRTAVMAATAFPAPTLTFTPSNFMTAQHCVIYSYDDSAMEDSEDFTVTLTVSGGDATVDAATATGTIRASDQPLLAVATDFARFSEGGTAVFTVTLSDTAPASGETVTVDWAVGGDVDASDYTVSGADTDGTLAFAALGSQTLTFAIANDNAAEDAETLSLTLSNPSGGLITTAAAAITIRTSVVGTPGTVTLAIRGVANDRDPNTPGLQVDEGDSIWVTYAAHGLMGGSIRANTEISGGTAADLSSPGNPIVLLFSSSPSVPVAFTILNDNTPEPDQTITVALGDIVTTALTMPPGPWTAGTPSGVTFTVRANDQPVLAVAVDDADTAEGDTAVFTVTLGDTAPAPGSSVTVDWAVSGDADTSDYTVSGAGSGAGGTLYFTGLGSQTLSFAIANDMRAEDAETLTLTLSNPSSGLIATAAATATIAASAEEIPGTLTVAAAGSNGDRDPAAPGLQVDEGDAIRLTFTAHGKTGGAVAATSFVFGTATIMDDVDITTSAPSFAIVAGATMTEATYRIVDDNIHEPEEFLTFAITGFNIIAATTPPTWTVGNPSSVTIAIRANDQPMLAVAVDDADTAEGDTVVFTVSLGDNAPASGSSVTVDWAVSGDVDTSDYTVSGADTDGTLAFAALGSQTLTFAIADDADREDAETLTFTLSNASGGVIATAAAVTTIAANDRPTVRTLTVTGPATIAENDDASNGVESGDYTITLTGAAFTAPSTTVTWTVASNTASIDDDFVAASDRSGTVIFTDSDGDGSAKTFTLTVAGDDLNEPDELFSVLASVADADADGGTEFYTGFLTIITDDDPVTVAIARHRGGAAAVAEDSGAYDFTVTLGGGTRAGGVSTIVPFTVGGAGVTDEDFDIIAPAPAPAASALGHSIAIAPDRSTGTITMAILDDATNEADESLTFTGTAVGAGGLRLIGRGAGSVEYVPSGDTASVEVTDNDPITVRIANGGTDADTASGFQVAEGSSATFTVTLSNASATAVQAPFAISGLEAADYTGALPTSPLTIAAGQLSGDIIIALDSDSDSGADDASEDFTVTLGATGYMAAGTIMRSGTPSERSATQAIVPVSRTLTVTGPTALTETDGDLESGDYTIALSGAAFNSATTVTWTVTDGTTVNDDFAAASDRGGTVSFGAGDTTRSFTLTVAGDDLNEAAETFTVQVSVANPGADGGTDYGAAAMTTINDDDPISVRIANGGTDADDMTAGFQVMEGGNAIFTVTLSAASASEVQVPFAIAGLEDADTSATPPASPLRIAANSLSGTIVIALARDTDSGADESSEALTVTLGASGYMAAGTITRSTMTGEQSATQSIIPFFARTLTVTGPATIAENDDATNGAESGDYTITLTGAAFTAAATTVTWTVYSSTASIDDDFVAASDRGGTVIFTDSDGDGSAKTFTLTVAGDDLNEPDEFFSVLASVANPGADGGTEFYTGFLTAIADDDPVTVAVARHSGCAASVAESAGSCDFTVTVAGGARASGVSTIVPFAVGGTGVTDEDFDITAPMPAPAASALGHSIAIAQGSSAGTVTLAILDDATNEASESFVVTGASAGNRGLRLTGRGAGGVEYAAGGKEASVEVTDNDPITVSIANGGTDADGTTGGWQVAEGGSATFTVTLSAASASEAQVPFIITGLDNADTSATPPASPLRIAAGQTSGVIAIALANDADSGADESSEDFTVSLGASGYMAAGAIMRSGTPSERSATQSIIPRQAVRTLTVTGPSNFIEGDGLAVGGRDDYTVTLTGRAFTAAATTVTWAVTHVTTADADFAPASRPSGTVIFDNTDGNNATKTFNIRVAGDRLNEARETFTVQVSVADSAADGGTAYGTAASTAIADNDSILVFFELGLQAPTVAEAASQTLSYSVQLAIGTATGDVTLPFSFSGLDNADYAITAPAGIAATATGGTLTLTPAVDNAVIAVAVTGNDRNEASRILTVTGGTPSTVGAISYITGQASAAVTITDDDDIAVGIARASGTLATVDEGQSADFTVTLSGASAGSAADIAVPYTVTASGGYTPTDAGGGSLTIAAGDSEGTITIQMPLSATLGAASDDQTVTVALVGDDAATPDMDEGPTAADGGGAVARSSTPADQSATVDVNFLDAAHTFTYTNPAAGIDETDSDANTTYTVARAGGTIVSGQDLVLSYAVTAGTAAAADFTGSSVPAAGTLTFGGSDSSQSFAIGIAGDDRNEPGETFAIALSIAAADMAAANANGGVSLPADLSVTINDDDPVTVAIARHSGCAASVAESAGSCDFTVTVAGGARASGVGTVVPFTVGGAGVTAGDFDITAPSGIPAGASGGEIAIAQADAMGTVTLTVSNDALNEATESLTLTGAAVGASGLRLTGSGAGAVEYASGGNEASVDVTDDDPIAATFAAASAAVSINEG